MATDLTTTRVLQSELSDVREELRRIDAKARDLLIVATLAVTIAATALSVRDSKPPTFALGVMLIAAIPWLAAVIQLALVIRPMMVIARGAVNRFPTTSSLDVWLLHRCQALTVVVDTKYARVRRAVDLLLTTVAITTVSLVLWFMISLSS